MKWCGQDCSVAVELRLDTLDMPDASLDLLWSMSRSH
jgi:hypothetical protein